MSPRRIGVAVLLLVLAAPAFAAPLDVPEIPWLHDIYVALADVSRQMEQSIATALRSAAITRVVNVLFTALAGILFVWRFAGYALRGFDMMDILELMFSIFFVYVFLASYSSIVTAVGDAGRYVGDVLGKAISGAPGDKTFAEAIFSLLLQLTLQPQCDGFWSCIGAAGLMALGVVQLGDMAIIILGIIATVVETWMQWCFMVAYGVGWFTIPFLLFRQLSFLFDGWLKFFFSVIMYDLIAKVTLAIVLLAFKTVHSLAPGSFGATIEVRKPFDLVALFLFVAIGVLILLITGRFATAMVAGVSGVGGTLQDMARGTARAFGR